MKRGSTKPSLVSTPCLEPWCYIFGAVCLLKLTLTLPPQPSEPLFFLSGEEGEGRGRSLWGFVLFLLNSTPPATEGIWWVQEAKNWGLLLGFSTSRRPSHISFQVGLPPGEVFSDSQRGLVSQFLGPVPHLFHLLS